MEINCPVSLGELVDKISILRIKQKFITDQVKLEHVAKEEKLLYGKLTSLGLDNIEGFLTKLIEVNTRLWKIEDDIREKERSKEFDEDFIALARAVYVTNDQRFELKNEINHQYKSGIVEVKSYEDYN